jgi:SlyX protein
VSEADHSARIEQLEVRIAYQDRVIEELNATVTDQWKQIDQLAKQIARMSDRLKSVEDNAPAADGPEPPPPHY